MFLCLQLPPGNPLSIAITVNNPSSQLERISQVHISWPGRPTDFVADPTMITGVQCKPVIGAALPNQVTWTFDPQPRQFNSGPSWRGNIVRLLFSDSHILATCGVSSCHISRCIAMLPIVSPMAVPAGVEEANARSRTNLLLPLCSAFFQIHGTIGNPDASFLPIQITITDDVYAPTIKIVLVQVSLLSHARTCHVSELMHHTKPLFEVAGSSAPSCPTL